MLCHFFASANDILPVLEQVDSRHSLIYTPMGLFESPKVLVVTQGVNIPTLKVNVPGPNALHSQRYLVTPADVVVQIREVPQTSGGLRYAFDQLINPDSIEFTPGGFYSSEILVYGRVGTVSDSKIAKALYRSFANAIKKQFVRIRAFWVGPQAEKLLHQGCRLTAGAQCPREYDLMP
jgi:hypothetical protein